MKQVKPKSFRATLERGAMNLGWTMIRIPFDAAKLWGSRGQIRIQGEINGFAFQTSLFPDGKGAHFLVINRNMQRGAKVKAGDTAQFRIEPDLSDKVAVLPPQLEAILKEDRVLKRWYDRLNHATRNYIGKWIVDVKSDEARARRADQIAERLLSVMEAEHELPPALKIAFASDPIAAKIWNDLAPSHRRNYLLAIFYYRDPQSRARRISKVFAELRQKRDKSQ